MLHRYRALVESLTPRQATEDETDRARFLVQVFLVVSVVCLAYAPLNLLSGMWGQLGLTAVVLFCSAGLLLLLARGVKLRVAMHLSLGALTLQFAASTLMQQPFDSTNLIALVLVPVMASYLLGSGGGCWLWASMALGVAAYAAGTNGLVVPVVDENPHVSAVFNLCFGILVAWIFTRRFDALRSRSLERMREADRAKNVFLATAGHEIRTPMNGVLGMTEVMLQEPQTQKQREQLEVIQRSGQHLVALIDDLLDVTRLEAGKLTVDVVAFDLHATLRDVEALARPQALAKGLTFSVERDEGLPRWVLGDSMRLGQVLNNLVSNALKFTPAGGQVRLAARAEGRRLALSVKDSGPGIPLEDQERVFRPFEQLDGGSRRRQPGTGLGLAISRQLVALMGGELSLDSAPGRGTTLEVRLPLNPAPREVDSSPALATERPGSAARVLVVDDNPVNLKVATALVEKAGFTALAASSGPQALAMMEQQPVCLVLMDCHMPDMDGFQTAERIRAQEREGARLPIVALTASAGPDDVAACKRAGMDECLAKPVRLDALREVLHRFGAAPATRPS
ncbi:MAG: response regulator [Myxococcales bacterium]|nr:response regulator [Myxococcales bacterium]